MDGADVGDVAETGAAVQQDVVVVAFHVVAQGVEEGAAAQPVVEVVPVEGADRGGVIAVLPSRRHEVEATSAGEGPVEGDGVRADPGVGGDRVGVGGRPGAGDGPRVVGDQVDDPGGGADDARGEEGVEEAVESGCLQVPVDGEHPVAVGGEDPRGVGQRHGPAGAALVRVERDDPAVRALAHRCPRCVTARSVPARNTRCRPGRPRLTVRARELTGFGGRRPVSAGRVGRMVEEVRTGDPMARRGGRRPGRQPW